MHKGIQQEPGKLSSEQRELLSLLLQEEGVQLPPPSYILPAPSSSIAPLSFSQQRLWFLHQLAPDSPAYNIPISVSISGPLNVSALHQALCEVIRRHHVLRSCFSSVSFAPVQTVCPSHYLPLSLADLSSLGPDVRLPVARDVSCSEARRPFDLSSAPLLRASLLLSSQLDFSLLFTLHHIVSDGWSMALLVKEVASLYLAFSSGLPSPLPELHLQYADFAHWQRNSLAGPLLDSQLSYWKAQLQGAPALLNLPTDRPRPPVQTFNGSAYFFSLPVELSARIRSLALDSGVTLYILLLTAFKVLLSRYCNQYDICVGSPISGRNRSELEPLIGFFVNMLVLRGNLSDDLTFSQLLARQRKVVLDAYTNQDVPFEMLVDQVNPGRNLSHSPLFQVMFILQNSPSASISIPSLSLATHSLNAETAKFDLSLGITDAPDSLIGSIEYNTDLFDLSSIERLSAHFRSLLEAIVTDPHIRLSRIGLLSPSERRQVLAEFNDTAEDFDLDHCLHDLIEAQAIRSPDSTAVVFEQDELSYLQLDHRANRLANFLRSQGVGPDSLVAVCCQRSIEMVVALLGVLKAGAAYVPIDPDYPEARIRFMLEDSSASMLLTQQRLLDGLPSLPVKQFCMDSDWHGLEGFSSLSPGALVAPRNLAYMIYTSGSTGTPKGAMISHRAICNRLLWMQREYRLDSTDVVLQKTPFSFDVSVWEFFWPLMTGARLVMARPDGHKDGSYLLELIARERVTTIHFVPQMLQLFLQQEGLDKTSSLRQVFSSGEALPAQLQRKFFQHLKAELHNLYGPTEAAVDVTYWRCSRDDERTQVPIGRPIANTQIYILDRRQEPVPLGVAGEICIAGEGLARGYHSRADLTAEKFVANSLSEVAGSRLYRTGDLGRHLADGTIEYLGRMDHQVKIRGMRIELGEIEAVLERHPDVERAVVVAREHQAGGRMLAAYVEMTEGKSLAIAELRDYVKQNLPDYMVPASITAIGRLPVNANGKVDRKALPEPDRSRPDLGLAFVPASTEVEQTIAKVWQEALNVDSVGIQDNFFDLGGHSILVVQVHTQLREKFDCELAIIDLFKYPTISALAQYIAQGDEGSSAAKSQALQVEKLKQGKNRLQQQLKLMKHAARQTQEGKDE